MTDRYNALTVVLERDIRDDDAAPIILAIQQVKGVLEVTGHVADMDSHLAEVRARRALQNKLLGVLFKSEQHT